ncbi:MAG: Bax inhibitor-1/YccA family protein [Nocardioidaceae bacterium]|nr:Bax inhibitor-1/YccA family protein [Nocardioidaceae bacterium]
MQSSNPVFRRAEGFNGRSQVYPASGVSYPAYGSAPAGGQTGYAGGYGDPSTPQTMAPSTQPMTIDSVVQKTGLTVGLTILTAAATWVLTPQIDPATGAAGPLYALAMLGAFGGLALSFVNSFKRVVSPPLVLAYAVLEGIFVGAFSKAIEAQFGNGLVIGAVVGTFAAVGGTLAAYKFFNIRVSDRFRKWVVAAMFGFVALALLDLVLSLFGASFGFNGFGPMGLISSVVGLGLGVLLLILDFDFVERGIAAGLPERESWRAAFGLTVTIIWIYIELLRILAILRGN